jgi:ubiquinone/menaquinone biosynthesis C-methylase UbiE
MPDNRTIYDEVYHPGLLDHGGLARYDHRSVEARAHLLKRYAAGDVLDLCCGSGSYLPYLPDHLPRVVGLDFSTTMLRELVARAERGELRSDGVVLAEAGRQPFPDDAFDTIFSFASLVYLADIDQVVAEIARLLRPGGHAILEFGNVRSLNDRIARAQHVEASWAASYHLPISEIRRLSSSIGRIVEWRRSQIVPLYGTTRRLRYLYPLVHPAWKRPMSVRVKGRTVDEWLSSLPLARQVAGRHLVVIERPPA